MKKIINTRLAPAPIGPYNQAVIIGKTLFTSGQIALNPTTMALVTDNIENETKQVMENLKGILQAADMTFKNVVKTTIFLTDMNDFDSINKVYSLYLDNDIAPARETVQVVALPKNVNIEISLIACED